MTVERSGLRRVPRDQRKVDPPVRAGYTRPASVTGSLNLRGVLNRDSESSRAISWASGATMMVSPAPRALSLEPENLAFRAVSVASSIERDTKRPRTLAAGPCVNGFDPSGR